MDPRPNRINWDDHHMMIALVTAQRSPDPNTQVGACIVKENKVLATGYNSFPRGINSNALSWSRGDESSYVKIIDTKYPYVVHAELNAIHNGTASLKGGSLYVTLHPCNHCMQGIIQQGIERVIYLENKYPDSMETQAAIKLANLAGIKLIQHVWAPEAWKNLNNLVK